MSEVHLNCNQWSQRTFVFSLISLCNQQNWQTLLFRTTANATTKTNSDNSAVLNIVLRFSVHNFSESSDQNSKGKVHHTCTAPHFSVAAAACSRWDATLGCRNVKVTAAICTSVTWNIIHWPTSRHLKGLHQTSTCIPATNSCQYFMRKLNCQKRLFLVWFCHLQFSVAWRAWGRVLLSTETIFLSKSFKCHQKVSFYLSPFPRKVHLWNKKTSWPYLVSPSDRSIKCSVGDLFALSKKVWVSGSWPENFSCLNENLVCLQKRACIWAGKSLAFSLRHDYI